MANKFDKGMDDYYSGKEPKGDPGIEYWQGYDYAESLLNRRSEPQYPEQIEDREY